MTGWKQGLATGILAALFVLLAGYFMVIQPFDIAVSIAIGTFIGNFLAYTLLAPLLSKLVDRLFSRATPDLQ